MPPVAVWGPPIWTLFHTLAAKIHEDKFNEIGSQLIMFIRKISRYLPCPDCSQHATTFFANVPQHMFQTKANFMKVLYVLHNHVNKRKNKPVFKFEGLSIYENRNIIQVYNRFSLVYNTRGNMKLLTDTFQRQLLLVEFKKWLITNIKSFM
jgi:hypothetical protein